MGQFSFDFDQFCSLSDALADFFSAAQLPDQLSQPAFHGLVAFAPDAIPEWDARIRAAVPQDLRKSSSQLFRLFPFVSGLGVISEFQTAHDVARFTVGVADDLMRKKSDVHDGIIQSWSAERSKRLAEALRDELNYLEHAERLQPANSRQIIKPASNDEERREFAEPLLAKGLGYKRIVGLWKQKTGDLCDEVAMKQSVYRARKAEKQAKNG